MVREEGGWTLLGPERRRCWDEKEVLEFIDEHACSDQPTRDIHSNAEALEKGGNNDGVGAIG